MKTIQVSKNIAMIFPKAMTVVMEAYGEERSKRVKVNAFYPEDAMAAAEIKFPGWVAVEVVA